MLLDERVDLGPQGAPAGLRAQSILSLQAPGDHGRQEVQGDRGEGGDVGRGQLASAGAEVGQPAGEHPAHAATPADRDREQALHRLLRQWQQLVTKLHSQLRPAVLEGAAVGIEGTTAVQHHEYLFLKLDTS
ncbi:hypothetical protein [Streptomyces milbemycinicus]|uniref:Uncharacterized protein n=1 Tax=Streptomyces milbemycinicus TaxID=476552 RepID=A0ABW8M2P3_9ACTN